MKIKVLKCCAGLNFSFSAGEIAFADNETAMDLIQAGYAEALYDKAEDEIPAVNAYENTMQTLSVEDVNSSSEGELSDADNESVDDNSEEIVGAADTEEVMSSGKGNRTTRKRAGDA